MLASGTGGTIITGAGTGIITGTDITHGMITDLITILTIIIITTMVQQDIQQGTIIQSTNHGDRPLTQEAGREPFPLNPGGHHRKDPVQV